MIQFGGGAKHHPLCRICQSGKVGYNWCSSLVDKWCGKCDSMYFQELSSTIYGTFSLTNPKEEVGIGIHTLSRDYPII